MTGVKTKTYGRVVGYYGEVDAMNDGKKQEKADRVIMTEDKHEHRPDDPERG